MQKFWIILITFCCSAALMPLIILFCKKHNLYDRVNSRKIHSGSIPRLGGIGIALSFLIGTLIYTLYFGGIELERVFPLIIAGMIIFIFGFIDDLLDIPALLKLVVQLVAVTIVVMFGYRFEHIFSYHIPMPVSVILTFGWVLGIINAYNLIDGLDGLCGSLSFFAFVTIGICLYLVGDSSGLMCLILAASVLGFLCFNRPPAKIFMGDCGSQFLGFMLAVTPLYETSPKFEYSQFFFMIVMVSIPMVDTLAAMWRRIREGKSIMHPDRYHVHHKLLNLGLSKVQALLVLVALQLFICGIAVVSMFTPDRVRAVILICEFALVVGFYAFLHYAHRRKMHKRGLPADESEEELIEKKGEQTAVSENASVSSENGFSLSTEKKN